MTIRELYKKQSADLMEVTKNLAEFHDQIAAVSKLLRTTFAQGNKVLVAGNGGSAAEAQHLSDEMAGRYKADRPAYPVIALTADGAVITCIGNDYGYESVFKRQVEALGKTGDVFIGLTTSGTSKNILAAAEQAKKQGMIVVGLTGPKGTLKETADYVIYPPIEIGARMQEMHLHAIHLLCEAFEPENIDIEI